MTRMIALFLCGCSSSQYHFHTDEELDAAVEDSRTAIKDVAVEDSGTDVEVAKDVTVVEDSGTIDAVDSGIYVVEELPYGSLCVTDPDCYYIGPGSFCRFGVCSKPCQIDEECGPGVICFDVKEIEGRCLRVCEQDSDCNTAPCLVGICLDTRDQKFL